MKRYPRNDRRDLALVRVLIPIFEAEPFTVATTPPIAGETVDFTGYRRTKTEWLPKQPHTAPFTVGSFDAREVAVIGNTDAGLCLGDSGAPGVRTSDDTLLALNSRSWQNNCVSVTHDTNNGAYATRLDDADTWIQQTVQNAAARAWVVSEDDAQLRDLPIRR
ncbi:hypothetical protein [Lysinibacter sp. HNR]|uniref:hypothetical protein n=1 Tax=Lysinibacter sp. HNR TaxID=3031408 RepID=UPI0024353501|nr:hypothetical protein [Lysinibacter sp. HNR]WGD37278.1 hypothetical protein FrondiHNR_12750 [Lysinibacter sp. HNR]